MKHLASTTNTPITNNKKNHTTTLPNITIQNKIQYLHGLNNHHESEAIPNSLPHHRNNPKICPNGLIAEQISGTAFTVPRHENKRTWLYRRLPSVKGCSDLFVPVKNSNDAVTATTSSSNNSSSSSCSNTTYFGHVNWDVDFKLDPNPLRWLPKPIQMDSPNSPPPSTNTQLKQEQIQDNITANRTTKRGTGCTNFIQGTYTMAGSGHPVSKDGIAIHIYTFDCDMRRNSTCLDNNHGDSGSIENSMDVHMYNSDGDFLIVPQYGSLDIFTEMGQMIVHPNEICVIPRGFVFSVNLYRNGDKDGNNPNVARGYILELFRGHFGLPELGPIGSNGLANARDFLIPTASVDQQNKADKYCTIITKFGNELFSRSSPHSPYNVVAWHGNYYPYKYNLEHFCCMNSVTYDHPDPSIYTVLTVPSNLEPGTALADFVVFPPRWVAMDEDTFRPPWYHRNCMSEYMGLIYGEYDAKSKQGFCPGGSSLHNTMVPHGPDNGTFQKATSADAGKEPTYLDGGLAFMFETCCMLKVSTYALTCDERDWDYAKCWDG